MFALRPQVVRTFDNGGSCRSLDFNPRREFLSCISGDAIHVRHIACVLECGEQECDGEHVVLGVGYPV